MPTSIVNYLGGLRTECTHVQSGSAFVTDAPTDNMGKGEAFSPTDLLATSLATCALTTMGIFAQRDNIPFPTASAEVLKVMANSPRRIAEIHVTIKMPSISYTEQQRKVLEDAGNNCPVAKSLNPAIRMEIAYVY